MKLLEGKVALISGIGPGMGRDIALLFADHGADVVLGARGDATVAEVAKEVEARGQHALPVRLDIADRATCDQAVATAQEEFGRIDVLVNNAFEDGDHKKFE